MRTPGFDATLVLRALDGDVVAHKSFLASRSAVLKALCYGTEVEGKKAFLGAQGDVLSVMKFPRSVVAFWLEALYRGELAAAKSRSSETAAFWTRVVELSDQMQTMSVLTYATSKAANSVEKDDVVAVLQSPFAKGDNSSLRIAVESFIGDNRVKAREIIEVLSGQVDTLNAALAAALAASGDKRKQHPEETPAATATATASASMDNGKAPATLDDDEMAKPPNAKRARV